MKILIGTPMHSVKDYALLRWLKSVSELAYPVEELFLVDNSPANEKYDQKLKDLVPQIVQNIPKITIIHIDIPLTDPEERVAMAREEIRKKVLSEGFDWWFSWEADVIAPPDVLTKLLKYGNEFKEINHASPSRQDPDYTMPNSFGLTLVHRDLLEKYPFAYQWGRIDPLMPNCYHGADSWFNRRVIRGGDGIIDLSGVIGPIDHLNE